MDVICIQKTYVLLNFVEKHVRLKWKKDSIFIEYAWILLFIYLFKVDCEKESLQFVNL